MPMYYRAHPLHPTIEILVITYHRRVELAEYEPLAYKYE